MAAYQDQECLFIVRTGRGSSINGDSCSFMTCSWAVTSASKCVAYRENAAKRTEGVTSDADPENWHIVAQDRACGGSPQSGFYSCCPNQPELDANHYPFIVVYGCLSM